MSEAGDEFGTSPNVTHRVNQIDQLIREYEVFACLPWDASLAGPQRVWFAVYDKYEERRLTTGHSRGFRLRRRIRRVSVTRAFSHTHKK